MIQNFLSYVQNGCDITLSMGDMDNTFDSCCTKGQLF